MPNFAEQSTNVIELVGPRRCASSAELIVNPLRPGETGFDKVFITGQIVRKEGGIYVICINQSTPTAVLNSDYRGKLGLPNSPTIPEMRACQADELSLVSGGTHLWIDQAGIRKMVLILRDERAPSDREFLTGAAGRCAEAPAQTCLNEGNEELVIFKKKMANGKTILCVANFAFEDNTPEQIGLTEQNRQSHIEEMIVHLNKLLEMWKTQPENDNRFLAEREIKRRIGNLMQIDHSELILIQKHQGPNEIITELGGHEFERFNGFAFFDDENNTLETRIIANIPAEDEIVDIIDGDTNFHEDDINFDPDFSPHKSGGREVVIETLDKIKNRNMVPALRNYVEMLSRDSNRPKYQ